MRETSVYVEYIEFMISIPYTPLGIDISWGTVTTILFGLVVFVFGRIRIISKIESKKMTKKKAHSLAIWLNYIGSFLLIFSAMPTSSISAGGYPFLVSFLPSFIGLVPIMLAFEIERTLNR